LQPQKQQGLLLIAGYWERFWKEVFEL